MDLLGHCQIKRMHDTGAAVHWVRCLTLPDDKSAQEPCIDAGPCSSSLVGVAQR